MVKPQTNLVLFYISPCIMFNIYTLIFQANIVLACIRLPFITCSPLSYVTQPNK